LFRQTLHPGASDLGLINPGFAGQWMTIEEILQEYSDLEEADILACIAYKTG